MAENGKKTATQGTAEDYEHVTGEETRNEAGKNAGGGSQRAVTGSIDGKTVKTEIGPGEAELLKKGKHAKTVLEYVHGCIDGTIIAGEDRILACERFLKFLERDDFEIRTHDADFVVGIIENTYCHRQGEALDGSPMRAASTGCWYSSTRGRTNASRMRRLSSFPGRTARHYSPAHSPGR